MANRIAPPPNPAYEQDFYARSKAQWARTYDQVRQDTAAALRGRGEQTAADALPTACSCRLGQITGDWRPSDSEHDS